MTQVLPDLCLSILDVCPRPVFEALAACMTQLGGDVFGCAGSRSAAVGRVCRAAADAVCNDDLDTAAAAANFLCCCFLADQPSPFQNNASAVLDVANFVRLNFVEGVGGGADAQALGHHM